MVNYQDITFHKNPEALSPKVIEKSRELTLNIQNLLRSYLDAE